MTTVSRRNLLAGAAVASAAAALSAQVLVDTHVHLFSEDRQRFPYHRNATYQPEAAPLSAYMKFVKEAGVQHTVIVHPEPYQDDHSYLEYCFANEPSPMFFKGTCLFDPIDPATPDRIEQLASRNPKRIVGLRIHCNRERGVAPTVSGAIRDRDCATLGSRPPCASCTTSKWPCSFTSSRCTHPRSTAGRGIRRHAIHHRSPGAFRLRNAAEYARILEMGRFKNVVMKFSGWPIHLGSLIPTRTPGRCPADLRRVRTRPHDLGGLVLT